MSLLVLALSTLVGVALGLLGGGGSILTVPILLYGAGLDEKSAIATSLLVVGVTSAFATIPHARKGNVRWKRGLLFAVGGMTGAFLGGFVAKWIPGGILLTLFALMMLATAFAMWRGRKAPAEAHVTGERLPVLKIFVEGLVVGVVTGLVGAGGGFLVVPALVLLGGMSMQEAVGTSLVVIALKSAAGFAGYVSHVPVDWMLALGVTAAAVVGSVGGAVLAHRIPAEKLRKGFAAFVVVMAIFMLVQQVV